MRYTLLRLSSSVAFTLCLSLSAWAQRTVTGTVTSGEDGSVMPGVNVVVKGTGKGASTGADGNYSLTAPDGQEVTLTFSFIGYRAKDTLLAADANSLSIKLQPDVKQLEEAVVIGYGTTTKRDVTGAVAQISSKDFQGGVVTTPEQLIAGKAAGVQIVQNGGSPGAGSTIRIRGGASLNASNDPLIVIDGVPVDNGGISGAANPLSLINPNDIESFSILKDASATAIYGSRASNGVILITTKKGAVGMKPVLTITSQNSVAQVRRLPTVLSAQQFRDVVNDTGTHFTNVQKRRVGNASTDWQKQIYQLAHTSDNNISYAGGAFGVPFRISGGYLNQTGVLKTDKLDRVTAGLNISPTFLDGHLKATLNLKGARNEQRFANQSAIGNALSFNPTNPVYSEGAISNRFGGYYEEVDSVTQLPNSLSPRNPVGLLQQQYDRSSVMRSIGNLQLDYAFHFLPELRANLNLGYDISRGQGHTTIGDSAAATYLTHGQYSSYRQDKKNGLLEFYLNYDKTFGDHHITLLAGYAFQDFTTTTPSYRTLNFQRDTTLSYPKPAFPSDKQQNRLESYYARANYSWKDFIVLTGTIRTDGSSRFAKEVRYGVFPSGAIAIRPLVFLQVDQKILSDLKLRGGIGQTGQQDIGSNYAYQPNYYSSGVGQQYQFGNQYITPYHPVAYDQRLRWESTTTYNAAVDVGFLNNRISATVDVYLKKTNNLLNVTPVPAGGNFSDQVLTNIGNLENRGIEITINTTPVKTKEIQWDFGFNITANRTRITKLQQGSSDTSYAGVNVGGISFNKFIQIQSVGYAPYSFYVLKQYYGPDGKPVEGKFYDPRFKDSVVTTDKVTDAMKVRYQQAAPKVYFGINTSLTYKRFTLTAVARGAWGNYVYNANWANSGNLNAIKSRSDFLTNANTNYLETRFVGTNKLENTVLSDYYVQKANFVRFDNIGLSYNFGTFGDNRFGLVLNANVQNPFVFTPYKGSDPEIPGGIDNGFYARPRVYTGGITLSFR